MYPLETVLIPKEFPERVVSAVVCCRGKGKGKKFVYILFTFYF